MITKINVFRNKGEWCYAAFSADGFDHGDTVGLADEASAEDVRAEMQSKFPDAEIARVGDTNE